MDDATTHDPGFDPGATLGRYVVLSRMGAGAMGIVYSAYDPELDRRVALKLMHQRGADEAAAERASQRMLSEAKAMASLSHPNVISVHDVGTIDGRVFIAMEFVDGVPLSVWLRQPHSWREILDMFVRAGRGLEAAHAGGLVHRDFKPDNVLVATHGRVRVLDFGLARRIDGTLEARDREAGTPAYMSPEQHLGHALDHRADQFSFCVALYQALYGELPFAGKSRLELALTVTEGKLNPAPKGTTVPSWVRAGLVRGLDPDPQRRFENMAALLEILTRDPDHKLRRAVVGGGAAAAVLTSLALLIQVGLASADEDRGGAPRCTNASDRIGAVWNDEHRDTMLDRRMLCLDRQLSELSSRSSGAECHELVDVIANSEAPSLARAGEAVRELPELDACEPAAIEAGRDPGDLEAEQVSALEQVAIGELERDLFRAHTLELTGAFSEAEALIESSLVGATVLGDARLLAKALMTKAQLARSRGQLEAVVPLLEDAELAAERASADPLRATILIALARAELESGGTEAGSRRVREARAVLARIGSSGTLDDATLDGIAARIVLESASDPSSRALAAASAETMVRDAIERVEASGSERATVELAELRTSLGVILRAKGPDQSDDARAELTRARSLWAEHYGPQHPVLATVRFELALVDASAGRHADALAGYEDVLESFERVYGPTSLAVGRASAAMAITLAELGRHDEALRHHQQARAIFRAKLATRPEVVGVGRGPALTAVELANTLDAEGLLRRELGQLDEALSLHQQALALLDAS